MAVESDNVKDMTKRNESSLKHEAVIILLQNEALTRHLRKVPAFLWSGNSISGHAACDGDVLRFSSAGVYGVFYHNMWFNTQQITERDKQIIARLTKQIERSEKLQEILRDEHSLRCALQFGKVVWWRATTTWWQDKDWWKNRPK